MTFPSEELKNKLRHSYTEHVLPNGDVFLMDGLNESIVIEKEGGKMAGATERQLLEDCIEKVQKFIELGFSGSWIHRVLKYLTNYSEILDKTKTTEHEPQSASTRGYSGGIIRVICTCGTEVKYRVPLKTLEDFICPSISARERK
jgi:hypothetical protein